MKKFFVFFIVNLVMCLYMAFPSYALDNSQWKSQIDSMINTHNTYINNSYSSVKTNYPYRAVCVRTNSSGALTELYFFYNKNPVINSGDKVYIFYVKTAGSNHGANNVQVKNPPMVFVNQASFGGMCPGLTTWLTSSDSSSYNWYFRYYMPEYSTAEFYNYASLVSGYDNILTTIDTSYLQTLITTAKSKVNEGYTSTSWQTLQNTIADSEWLLGTAGYTQSQVDSAKNSLQAALDGLLLLPDISDLQALITTAESKVNEGYTSTSWQALESAITSAESLLNTSDYTQSQVDNAKTSLQAALDGLLLLPDISDLQALINMAKSEADIDYTEESWQALQSAITVSESLLNTNDYTKIQIDSAIEALQMALDGLEPLPPPYIPPDTVELEDLLVEADAIEDIGYTVPTWTRFDNARIAGHELLSRPMYTQPEVDNASTELLVSINGLTLQTVTPPSAPLGFDLATGDISGFLSPAYPIFSGYVTSLYPILIVFLSIIIGIKIIPIVFEKIFRGYRR